MKKKIIKKHLLDIKKRLKLEGTDSYEDVFLFLNKKIDDIIIFLTKLSDEDNNINSTSVEIADASDLFADTAQTNASTVEEITATVEEISATSENVSSMTEEQNNLIKDININLDTLYNIVNQAGQNMQNAIEIKNGIDDKAQSHFIQAEETLNKVTEGVSKAENINNIINTVKDISDQLSLLSLNASIEGARAGEHGRGFSVVAEEIGKLANQSTDNVKEIERQLKEIFNIVDDTAISVKQLINIVKNIISDIGLMSTSIDKVAELAQEDIKVQKIIGGQKENIRNEAEQIANAMSEQTVAIEEVVRSITVVNNAIQLDAETSRDLSNKANELQDVSQKMINRVSNIFQVKIEDFNVSDHVEWRKYKDLEYFFYNFESVLLSNASSVFDLSLKMLKAKQEENGWNNIYIFSNFMNAKLDKTFLAKIKESSIKTYKLYDKKISAVIGITGLKQIIFNTYSKFNKEPLFSASSEKEGLEFLYNKFKKLGY